LLRRNLKSHVEARGLVVLPAAARQLAQAERRRLAKSRLTRHDPATEPLLRVLSALNLPLPESGLAALRLWGQTGERPAGWHAAADPVCLEAGLNHLYLRVLSGPELPEDDVAEIFEHLQEALAADRHWWLFRRGTCGYLQCDQAMSTASASPSVAQGDSPGDFMPEDEQASAHDRLQGEVQMCLHENAVNRRREQTGMHPVNALWIWGGGTAPGQSITALPPLYADDPLFTGYWLSRSAQAAPWPGAFDACLEASPQGFVAVAPTVEPAGAAGACLRILFRMLEQGGLRRLTLLFPDGLRADCRRSDRLRWWRRDLEALSGLPAR
jgi:hypothetical protein